MPVIDTIKQAFSHPPSKKPVEEQDEDLAPGKAVLSEGPVFDHSKITVIFVLGGPGVGVFPVMWWPVVRNDPSSYKADMYRFDLS